MSMIRLALASVASLALAVPALAGTPVALRAAPTSAGAAVTLADVFDGADGAAANTALAPAPAPGMNAVLDAGQVQMAARRAGFDWSNDLGVRRIVVASIGGPAVAQSRAKAGGPARPGRTQALAYARNLAAGEIVQAGDLIWSDEAIAGADSPGDPDAVIGQAAKRPLRAGAAVQARDLGAAIAVRRNETISVAYEAPGVSLLLQGKALKDAAVGESVQVLNPQSKKVIEAVVAGPGRALVGPRADSLKARAFSTASLR